MGTSLVVQWLRLRVYDAGGLGSIPGQRTRSCMPQLRSHMPQLKIPHATMKIPHAATKIPCAASKTRHSRMNEWMNENNSWIQKIQGVWFYPRSPTLCPLHPSPVTCSVYPSKVVSFPSPFPFFVFGVLSFIQELIQNIPDNWVLFCFVLFLMWTIFFEVFFVFVTTLLLLYVLVFWPWGMWDLSYLTWDQTCTPCIGRWSLNHWTAREVPR